MTMDYSGRSPETSATDAEGVLFAAEPVWDRAARRRRGLGGRRKARGAEAAPAATVAAEPRSFAPDPLDAPLDRPAARVAPTYDATPYDVTPTTLAAEAPLTREDLADESPMFAPIGRPSAVSSTRKASGGTAAAAMTAGAIAVVALGATGWWMSRDASGVPELTPGSSEAASSDSQVAVAPITPAPAPVAPPEMAVNPPANAAPTRMASAAPVRAERRAPAVRTRPAAASAEMAAANASTTLPEGPQPYSALNPSATPAPVDTPTLAIPPAPAEPIPSTPPVAPEPAPATATDTPTPPQ